MHVAIIMDGNRTWAKRFNLPWIDGHKKGADAVKNIIECCPKLGIKTLTLYAFSTENFKRSQDQVDGILEIIAASASTYKVKAIKEGIRVKLLGDISRLPKNIKDPLVDLMEETKNGNVLTVQLAVSYGGRDEIVRAVNKLVNEGREITEESISQQLDTPLEPDIVIRTGGQMRTSNFLPWQSVYSELFFVEKNWPDFTVADLEQVLLEYAKRNRKFGR